MFERAVVALRPGGNEKPAIQIAVFLTTTTWTLTTREQIQLFWEGRHTIDVLL